MDNEKKCALEVAGWKCGDAEDFLRTNESRGKRVNVRIDTLTKDDWLQIENAANGGISGTCHDWPELMAIIDRVRGRKSRLRHSAAWARGFCEAVLAIVEVKGASGANR